MSVGVIQLINGQPPNRGNTCISGYDAGKPNYALSNFAAPDASNNPHKTLNGKPAFAFQDPDLGRVVKFPTSEHYLHFQQLSKSAKEDMLQKGWADAPTIEILRGKTDKNSKWYIGPNQLNDDIKNSQGTYDDAKWIEKSKDVQMQMNATKYQQSPGFRASIDEAIKLGAALDGGGAATVIEDTASIKSGKPENKWGTGPRGEGLNMLGNSQTAFANMIKNDPNLQRGLTQANAPPGITQFATTGARTLYNQADAQYKSGVQVALKNARAGFPNAVNQPDTSDLGPGVVRSFANASQVTLGAASNAQTASAAAAQPSSPRRQSAAEFILSKVGTQYGMKDLKVKPDMNIPGQSVVHLNFTSPQHAQAFVAAMKNQNIHLAAHGDNVFLAQDKQQSVFNAIGVGNYGRSNPQPITTVLLQQSMGAQAQPAPPQQQQMQAPPVQQQPQPQAAAPQPQQPKPGLPKDPPGPPKAGLPKDPPGTPPQQPISRAQAQGQGYNRVQQNAHAASKYPDPANPAARVSPLPVGPPPAKPAARVSPLPVGAPAAKPAAQASQSPLPFIPDIPMTDLQKKLVEAKKTYQETVTNDQRYTKPEQQQTQRRSP